MDRRRIIQSEHKIFVNSETLRYGLGCFETVKINKNSEAVFLREHLERLFFGCNICKINNINFNFNFWEEKIKIFLRDNLSELENFADTGGVLRITATKEHGLSFQLSSFSENYNNKIINLIINNTHRVYSGCILNKFKSFNYLSKYLAFQEAREQNFHDSLLLNEKNQITETTRANIFFRTEENIWITPSLSCGCLNGIIRQKLINIFPIQEREIYPEQLESFTDCVISNSIHDVIKINNINTNTKQINFKNKNCLDFLIVY